MGSNTVRTQILMVGEILEGKRTKGNHLKAHNS